MKIKDFNKDIGLKNIEEIDAILRIRYAQGYNSLWLRHESPYPYISILSKEDMAYAHHFPGNRQAGFRSVGSVPSLEGEMTMFRLRTLNEEQPILNDAVILFSAALSVAKEFFNAKSLPRSIKWFEL